MVNVMVPPVSGSDISILSGFAENRQQQTCVQSLQLEMTSRLSHDFFMTVS